MRSLNLLLAACTCVAVLAQEVTPTEVLTRLQPLDAYMVKVMTDFNSPGIGIAVVSGDQLVFAKGYGFRDYGKKLPFTKDTLFQIASNTKLFTAVSAGMLVEEGKLNWDRPIREEVPSIR